MHNGEKIKNDSEPARATGWEYLAEEDIAKNESNINSKTGKERTFSEFDLYPMQPGESKEDYGKRLRFMHEKTAEYEAAEAEKAKEPTEETAEKSELSEYFESAHGQKELKAQDRYDRLEAKLDKAVAEGRMSEAHANALLEKELERFDAQAIGYRQDYEDSKVVGTPEEQEAYQKWLEERDEENRKNLVGREEHIIDGEKSAADKLIDSLDENIKSGRLTEEEIRKITGFLTARAEEMRSGDKDDVETPEDDTEIVESDADIEERAKIEAEERTKIEAEERGALEAEEREKAEIEEKEETTDTEALEEEVAKEEATTEADVPSEETVEKSRKGVKERIKEINARLKEIFVGKKRAQERIAEIDAEIAKIEDRRGSSEGEILVETEPDRVAEAKAKIRDIDAEIAAIKERNGIDEEEMPVPEVDKSSELPDDIISLTKRSFIDIAGEDGVEFMTTEEDLDEDTAAKIEAWWNTLDDKAKDEITQYEIMMGGSRVGAPLKTWLIANGLM